MSLSGREVVLGVGGGIAAYKACDLLRRLQDHGYLVTVVPTPAALNFVGKATWQALSNRAVYSQVWENVAEIPHIHLANNADYIVIAPATADLIARIAHGRADDLLTNVVLASSAKVLLVPAMHPQMWLNAATQENVETLKRRGMVVLEPDNGRLTGKDSGPGRFPETSRIISEFAEFTGVSSDLIGRRVLITAGGTREAIDPVRFIGNRSSGKQGFALAQAAAARGALVHVIAANVSVPIPEGIEVSWVESSKQMQSDLEERFPNCDVLIMCAAVADARPAQVNEQKIKKDSLGSLSLVATPDLLATVAASKKQGQVIIAFAAETSDHIAQAQEKLSKKGADLLYVNDVTDGAVFGSDLTHGSIIDHSGIIARFTESSKDTLAHELLNQVVLRLS
ncbi:MAG: bifunctional phosphopantothenoylcysteine decarboxylase/phosphopantothenate--cysteine ligase CoaBC [Actinobacteria bacterium]|nr:bifunctional phosphopantothenoylcysteine decarboxylase/phosphopantothenate--cysteine ligase CoaBC [Actinomycetota bacterium]